MQIKSSQDDRFSPSVFQANSLFYDTLYTISFVSALK